jgi:ankyrin repeat protein
MIVMQGIDIAKAPARFQPIIQKADTKPQDGFISSAEAIPAATEISKFLGADTTMFKDNDKAMEYLMKVMGVEFVKMPESEATVIPVPEASKSDSGVSKEEIAKNVELNKLSGDKLSYEIVKLEKGSYGSHYKEKIGNYTLDCNVVSWAGIGVHHINYTLSKGDETLGFGQVYNFLFALVEKNTDKMYIFVQRDEGSSVLIFSYPEVKKSGLGEGVAEFLSESKCKNPLILGAVLAITDYKDPINVKLLLEAGADVNKYFILNSASRYGHEAVINMLIEAGADINAYDSSYYSSTPIIDAAYGNNESAVKILIKAGADVNAQTKKNGKTALIEAANRGNIKIVKMLLEVGADVNLKLQNEGTALIEAANNGNIEIVKMLIEAGADLNGKLEEERTFFSNSRNCIVTAQNRTTALMAAANNGHIEIVKMLIKAGASDAVNAGDESLFEKRVEIAGIAQRELLSEEAKKLIESKDVNAKDKYGSTILMRAVFESNIEVVKNLIEAGVDLNVKASTGRTALNIAVSSKCYGIAKMLIKAGADVNIKDDEGYTALGRVSSVSYKNDADKEIINILKENGAKSKGDFFRFLK